MKRALSFERDEDGLIFRMDDLREAFEAGFDISSPRNCGEDHTASPILFAQEMDSSFRHYIEQTVANLDDSDV